MLNRRDTGSAVHIIVTILFVAALLFALGFIFWNNFLRPGAQTAVTEQPAEVKQPAYTKGVVTDSQADIWAGYVATGHTFTSVEGRTQVPEVTCTSDKDGYAAWVGFDGFGTDTVEQVGFTGDCTDTSNYVKAAPIKGVGYYAWAMMYNAGDIDVFDIRVRPGDIMFYKVAYIDGQFEMTITNETADETVTKSYKCKKLETQGPGACARAQAEWIVERPGNSSLAKFDPVRLYDNKATAEGGTTLPADGFDTYRLDMIQAGNTLANTSLLDESGAFSVLWLKPGFSGILD